jgi:SAM-dependent methyltransferase
MKKQLTKFLNNFRIEHTFKKSLPFTGRVLDVGCGEGKNGLAIKSLHPGIELHGVDMLPGTDVPDIYSYKQLDLNDNVLPYPDGYFDTIFLTHVIEHLHSPLLLGNELNRISKKGARIYVEAPNWTTLFVPSFGFHREQHNPFNFFDDPTHIRPWSKQGLFEFLFYACNFRVIQVGTNRSLAWIPLDLGYIVFGLFRGNRTLIVSSFSNIFGWSIYGIGEKD